MILTNRKQERHAPGGLGDVLYARDVISKHIGKRCSTLRKRFGIVRRLGHHPVQVILIFVELIKTEFMPDPQHDQDRRRQPHCQPDNIDKTVELVSLQIPECYF
jgi:hypothetical protein